MDFLKKHPSIVGLEIDTGVIRAVELRMTNDGYAIPIVAEEAVAIEAISEGLIKDANAVKKAVGKLWVKAGFKSRQVVLGIFGHSVIIRLIDFPKVPEERLAQALHLKSSEYFPIPPSQLVLNHAVVGEKAIKDGDVLEILLVAAKRAELSTYIEVLESNNLQPIIAEPTPLALRRVLPAKGQGSVIAVADLSNGLSSLVVYSDGKPRFVRGLPISLSQYLQEKGLPYSSSKKKDETAQALGLLKLPEVAFGKNEEESPLNEWALKVVNEVLSSVNYYQQQNIGKYVDSLFLSGRGARVRGLAEMLEQELEIPVKLINPMENISDGIAMTKENKALGRVSTDFAVSFGLALRGFEEV